VKLLIDENLPPWSATLLTEAGHDAVHVRDLDTAGSSEPQIIDIALADGRTIVSADSDFGALLASTGAAAPSVILVREVVDRQPPELAELLTACIEQLEPSWPQARWSPSQAPERVCACSRCCRSPFGGLGSDQPTLGRRRLW
jgi:predicted nuclease of predicted toxin-antitoxin system